MPEGLLSVIWLVSGSMMAMLILLLVRVCPVRRRAGCLEVVAVGAHRLDFQNCFFRLTRYTPR